MITVIINCSTFVRNPAACSNYLIALSRACGSNVYDSNGVELDTQTTENETLMPDPAIVCYYNIRSAIVRVRVRSVHQFISAARQQRSCCDKKKKLKICRKCEL